MATATEDNSRPQLGVVRADKTDSTAPEQNGDDVFEVDNNVDKPTINHVEFSNRQTTTDGSRTTITNVLTDSLTCFRDSR